MATITFEVAAGQTVTHTRTVTGAHLTRLVDAERAMRGVPQATDAQVLEMVANEIFGQLKARVLNYERNQAAQAIVEIALT